DRLASVGTFLRAAAERCTQMPLLFQAVWGNNLPACDADTPLQRLTRLGNLDPENLEQLPALPLRSRVRIDPWDDRAQLVKPVLLRRLSPRDQAPFETTPVMLTLQPPKAGEQATSFEFLLIAPAKAQPPAPALK